MNNVEEASKNKKWESNKFDPNIFEKESRNTDRLFSENELCVSQDYPDYEFKEMMISNNNEKKIKFSIVKNYQPQQSLISKIKNSEKDARLKDKSKLSDSTITSRSSHFRSVTPSDNPKKNQLVIKDHYLNRENSYSKMNEKKKQLSNNDFQKLMNTSNIDLKAEKNLMSNSYAVSPLKKDDRIMVKNKPPISKLVANQKNINSEQNLAKLYVKQKIQNK